jgi:Ca-activated chloride channel family protein
MTLFRFAIAASLAATVVVGALPAAGQDGKTRPRRTEAPAATAPPPAAPARPGAAAQQEIPIDNDPIELATDVVNVLFSVTDHQNRFVPDVAEKDVVVTEAGVQQRVFSFAKQTNLPLAVAIVVDVSSSQEYTFADEKRAAQAFLQSVLRPRKDTAAIVKFREDTDWVQGMTNRLERVYEAFNRLQWESRTTGGSRFGATALYDAIGVTATELFPKPDADPTPETMVRRAIVVLTDGADNASDRTLQEAIDDAIRSDVIVYTIGIGDRYRSTAVKRDVLEAMARQTGGRAYFPESYGDLRDSFKQIDEELRSQYVLAYEPTNTARDGSFREIQVAIPGRQDIRIFHRKGYYAPKTKVTP